MLFDERGYLCEEDGEATHRKIYRETFGRPPKGWHVHHIDYNKYNNSAANLIALPKRLHEWIHTNFKLEECPNREYLMLKIEVWEKAQARKDQALAAVIEGVKELDLEQLEILDRHIFGKLKKLRPKKRSKGQIEFNKRVAKKQVKRFIDKQAKVVPRTVPASPTTNKTILRKKA